MSEPAIPAITPEAATALTGAALLDVRESDEYDAGHAPAAQPLPLSELAERLGDVPTDRTVVCICRSGNRSARAVAFLRRKGIDAMNLTGGMRDWESSGLPVVTDGGAAGRVI